jgi:ribonuclease HII
MASLAADLGHYERRLREHGFRLIAGVDEVGRGALAGPLVAAAVILPEDFDLEGIADSKLLTKLQRERAYERICAGAVCRSMVKTMPTRIDRRGLHRSNISLLRRAVMRLEVRPDYVLTDGFPVRRMPLPALSIKKGDAVTASIAAASIVAKVQRDRMMDRYHRRFPEYGFRSNKGYGTRHHWETLDRLGPTEIHRMSFKGVGRTWESVEEAMAAEQEQEPEPEQEPAPVPVSEHAGEASPGVEAEMAGVPEAT